MRTSRYTDPGSGLVLWGSWALGPVSWALHQNISFTFTSWVCEHGGYWVFLVATLGALAVASVGTALAIRSARAFRRLDGFEDDRRVSRRRFMALSGLAISIVSSAGILVESIPVLMLDACGGAT